MHTQIQEVAPRGDLSIDTWTLLTGRSATIIAGFVVDLWRLGLYRTKQALAAHAKPERGAVQDWSGLQECGNCGSGSR
jgi:hypothetical protein